jgi:hypothetical protein
MQAKSQKVDFKSGHYRKMALFPIFGLVCYIALILYFKSKRGYQPVQLCEAFTAITKNKIGGSNP